ncbi:MAG: LacI family DNA-binding transcriptional regulator [Spirochaetaceae bacterium]|jgi:LacI family transcriptional regulator|nr:LacI family DNA-binding transcriptional regulator [Spirochaetaceae bacterium]
MSPRIIDIAKAAEVSPSAVSLALNNKSGVSDDVRQNILRIAAQMGYKTIPAEPYRVSGNIVIKMLKIAKHGHIVNERHNAFITEYLEGISEGAKKRKHKLEVSFFNAVQIQDIVEAQRGIAADGLIVLGTELNAHELSFFTELSCPIVFIDTYFPMAVFDCVDIDNDDGVFRSVQHLYNCGHRSIGLIRSAYETRNFRMREEGFREALEYFSLPVQEKYIVSVDPTFEKSTEDMNRFLAKHNVLPTAFFCMNDIIAYGCMKALRDHNYRIPEDVSVIGFDDLPSSAITEPPLTTVRVSTHQIGERALERLSDKINGLVQGNPEKILISGTLVVRNSVRII